MILGCTHSGVRGRLWAQGASAPKKLLWGLWALPPGYTGRSRCKAAPPLQPKPPPSQGTL